ncbi:MAG TPA: rhodanese-like domain-containing protein [Burkholderiales bacterium]|nr:rhodanese-like domain-containing protein [Burkholderiales bacterium]
MPSYDELVKEASLRVKEIYPWDLRDMIASGSPLLLLDVREPSEFSAVHIPGSVNVPRGVLEQACEWDYEETLPQLASRQELDIVVICRSGKRSLLAADRMLEMGFAHVVSLKTGVRGWNDFEQPLANMEGEFMDADDADLLLSPKPRADQKRPA